MVPQMACGVVRFFTLRIRRQKSFSIFLPHFGHCSKVIKQAINSPLPSYPSYGDLLFYFTGIAVKELHQALYVVLLRKQMA